jgi:hypothetical protein
MGLNNGSRHSGGSVTEARAPRAPYDYDTIEAYGHNDECHECRFTGWCLGDGPRSRVEDGSASTKEEIVELILEAHKKEGLTPSEVRAKMRERLWTKYSSRKADI